VPAGPGLTPPTGHMAACGGGYDTAPFPTPSSPFILRGLCYILEINFRVYVGGVSVWESQVLEGGKIAHQVAVQGSWDGGTGAWFRVTGRTVAAVPGPAPATPRWRGRWGERWRCSYQVKSKSSTMTSIFSSAGKKLPTCIFCSHRSRINCSSWLHAENHTKHKMWSLNNTGSRPRPQCTRASEPCLIWWDLSGSSLYLSNEICYKLQYVKHRHHYIHIITITKHRELLEHSLRSLSKSKPIGRKQTPHWPIALHILQISPLVPSITPTQLSLRTTACIYYCK
jgi:hypothetical protein